MLKTTCTLLILILLFSCHQGKQGAPEQIDSVKQNIVIEEGTSPSDSAKSTNDFDYSDCIRGQADEVIKKTVYPNSIFALDENNHTGTETVTFDNGDKLIIRNWGCEYYLLTFRFETSRFKADTTDIQYWLEKATILMREIEKGLDAPLNISGGTSAIENHLRGNKGYSLREEITYNDDLLRGFVTLDKVQKVNDDLYAVEISYATGPL